MKFCIECNKKQNTEIIKKRETYNVKGVEISIEARVKKCIVCHTEILDVHLDGENLNKAYNKYREQENLIKISEIIKIRERYKLTQKTFALILGMGEKTITRYENGALPDRSMSLLIRSMNRLENFKEAYETNKKLLNESEIKSIEKTILKIEENDSINVNIKENKEEKIIDNIIYLDEDIVNNRMKYIYAFDDCSNSGIC